MAFRRGGGREPSLLVYMALLLIPLLLAVAMLTSAKTVIVRDSSPGVTFSSVRKHPFDVYADPYHPPERANPYLNPGYQQVGVLKGQGGHGNLMPLFGRPAPNTNGNKWEYYTMAGNMKLPVSNGHRKCQGTGCDELQDDRDKVHVSGLGKFDTLLYGVEDLRYSPYT